MKDLFLTLLGMLLMIGFVRFIYGLQANQSSYVVQVLLELPPDVKEHFDVVMDSIYNLRTAFRSFRNAIEADSFWLPSILKGFFKMIEAFFKIPVSIFEFLILILEDLGRAIAALTGLLFGEAGSPIVSPLD